MDFKTYITEAESASARLEEQKKEINELLKILDLKIKKNMTPKKEIGEKINWTHVSSIGHVITSLKNILEFLE